MSATVRLRDSASWWRDEDDGSVTLVVLRRVPASEGSWLELTYNADDERGCEVLYDADCRRRYERSARLAEKRRRWGT